MLRDPRWQFWARTVFVAAAITALALRSLVHDGYLLQVDIAFGPVCPVPVWDFYAPVSGIQLALCTVIGGAATGRVYVVVALFLCAFAPMLCLRGTRWYAQIAAGVLGALNPWVYDRVADGQWGVTIAAAGLFLWLAAWARLRERPGALRALLVALAALLVVAFSANMIVALGILGLGALLGGRVWRSRLNLRWTAITIALTVVVVSYGAIPFFAGHGPRTYQEVASYTAADFRAFASVSSSSLGLWPSLLGLYGYWGEATGRFVVASSVAPWWPVTTLVLIGLAVYGAYRTRTYWLLVVGLIGVAISASTATTVGFDVVVQLAQHLPILGAIREPEKYSALWLVAVVLLSARGIDSLGARWRTGWRRDAGPIAALIVIAAAILPGGAVVLRDLPASLAPVRYPASWLQVSSYLRVHADASRPTLVLPWHLYQVLPFVQRLTTNPAPVVFPGALVVPNDIEIPGRLSDVPSPRGIGEVALDPKAAPCQLAGVARAASIQWVIVFNVEDGARNLDELEACGYQPRAGSAGEALLLRGQ